MSTGQDPTTHLTYNATAELFVNTVDNRWLDRLGFVPICTVDKLGLRNIQRFPSYGELVDFGGPGPSLGRLYAEGNAYIEANPEWAAMAKTSRVRVLAPVAPSRILDAQLPPPSAARSTRELPSNAGQQAPGASGVCDALRAHGVEPGQSWGRLTEEQIAEWKQHRCDRFFCRALSMESVGKYRCVPLRRNR